MTEKEPLGSAVTANKTFALIVRKNFHIDELNNILNSKSYDNTAILMTVKKSFITIAKKALKIALWIIASIAVFMVIMALSVFAFYLNGQREKNIESDLTIHKLQDRE